MTTKTTKTKEVPLIPPLKPKPIKSRRKTKTYGSGTATYGSGTGTSDRVSSGTRRFNFTARDIVPQPVPEWQYLFSPEEWEQINPVDREEVKKVIVAFSLWGDAYDLTKIFKGYTWRKEAVATRLKLLLYALDRGELPRVDKMFLLDGTPVYAIYECRNNGRLQVFDCESMIPKWISKDELGLPF